ncbi:EAL domain protein [Marinomonas spartinae]|uniref:EAL and HDOD domain-containing protein n=1 Tax=Marinomonas spartinae TaxID=1792290 RepID=UPI000808C1A6|nr:HDOD domain-containing protein [Marinomonas spartinae]SBS27327.1 EAL domain protein [Marinomonas spartinae]
MSEFPSTLDELMMAQQPIFKRNREMFGYELLFRDDNHTSQASVDQQQTDGNMATSQVLVNLCIGINQLERQIGMPFFVNMTTELILSDAFIPIDPNTLYIEIIENQVISDDFIEAVARWRQAGYRFALDHYQFSEEYEALLPFVSVVKVDVKLTPPHQFAEQINQLKARGLILLAERVEDQSMFELCKDIGFDLFQGYFLQSPSPIKGKKIDSTTQSALRLVTALQDKDISINKVAELVGQSPKLSFQLLRILNSPLCGISKQVESIKDAVIFLGLVQIKRWALLITLASSSSSSETLMKMLLTRGRCCQLLAEQDEKSLSDTAFITGTMSGIDALYGVEKHLILEQISLGQDIIDAIFDYKGQLGEYLKITLAIENQQAPMADTVNTENRAKHNRAFLDAMIWTNDVLKTIS